MEKIFRERLDFDVKIRLIGAVCSAICIAVRAVYFPHSAVNALVMLVPLFIAEGMGFVRVMLASLESEDEDDDRIVSIYEKVCEKFRRESAGLCMTARIIKLADLIAAVIMAVSELQS